jgi:dUTP pyrophosphatase
MIIPVKLCSPIAKLPTKQHSHDAGYDLYATSVVFRQNYQVCYGTGIKILIPESYVGKIYSRSSIRDTGLFMSNSVGVIDAGYTGEIFVTFRQFGPQEIYTVGDRIAQLVIEKIPDVKFEQVEELAETERGENGYGSTGK